MGYEVLPYPLLPPVRRILPIEQQADVPKRIIVSTLSQNKAHERSKPKISINSLQDRVIKRAREIGFNAYVNGGNASSHYKSLNSDSRGEISGNRVRSKSFMPKGYRICSPILSGDNQRPLQEFPQEIDLRNLENKAAIGPNPVLISERLRMARHARRMNISLSL
jgi:hypothetical protein